MKKTCERHRDMKEFDVSYIKRCNSKQLDFKVLKSKVTGDEEENLVEF